MSSFLMCFGGRKSLLRTTACRQLALIAVPLAIVFSSNSSAQDRTPVVVVCQFESQPTMVLTYRAGMGADDNTLQIGGNEQIPLSSGSSLSAALVGDVSYVFSLRDPATVTIGDQTFHGQCISDLPPPAETPDQPQAAAPPDPPAASRTRYLGVHGSWTVASSEIDGVVIVIMMGRSAPGTPLGDDDTNTLDFFCDKEYFGVSIGEAYFGRGDELIGIAGSNGGIATIITDARSGDYSVVSARSPSGALNLDESVREAIDILSLSPRTAISYDGLVFFYDSSGFADAYSQFMSVCGDV